MKRFCFPHAILCSAYTYTHVALSMGTKFTYNTYVYKSASATLRYYFKVHTFHYPCAPGGETYQPFHIFHEVYGGWKRGGSKWNAFKKKKKNYPIARVAILFFLRKLLWFQMVLFFFWWCHGMHLARGHLIPGKISAGPCPALPCPFSISLEITFVVLRPVPTS